MGKKKLMVIEPHSDDSAIAIGGFLDKYRKEYDYYFLVCAISEIRLHHIGVVSRESRIKEYENHVEAYDGAWVKTKELPFDCDSKLDTIPKADLILAIERAIATVKPAILICQAPSFHQDHTLVYEAVIAATRPTTLFMPGEMYLMENPTYIHCLGRLLAPKPDLYCQLTEEQLTRKLDCFLRCFPTQQREGRNVLSAEGIRSFARYRGIEAGLLYAEALYTYIRRI